jgi:hypothetical protein
MRGSKNLPAGNPSNDLKDDDFSEGESTMKGRILGAVLALSGVPLACAETAAGNAGAVTQRAETRAEHEALAERYERAANDMETKAEEHRKALQGYEKHPYTFPREEQAREFETHNERLIDIYRRAAESNRRLAEAHRQMAAAAKR